MTRRPLSIIGTMSESYSFASGHLLQLMDLGKGPAVLALAFGLFFDFSTVFQATPVYTFASVIAFSWFSFYVFRLVLLGEAKARLPAPPTSSGEGPSRVRPLLANFMGRALAMGIAAMGVFFLLAIVVVFPLTLASTTLEARQAMPEEAGFEVVYTLIIAFGLFALPVAIPLARCSAVLPALAIDRDTSFGAAWRLSRGYGLRLAAAWVLIAAPYFFGYALLNSALTDISAMLSGGGPGYVANLLALLLVTAMGMTVTALATIATARAWSTMTAIPTAESRHGPVDTLGVK
ncbi:MAG: hypothetical protein P8Q36_06795 [Alphaproteobacteria bacterium]|nr:hypothetical protein [Alphaproteobacteria bacterium]